MHVSMHNFITEHPVAVEILLCGPNVTFGQALDHRWMSEWKKLLYPHEEQCWFLSNVMDNFLCKTQVGEKLGSHKWFPWAIVFVRADMKLNKELMKSSIPNDMTGLVSETFDLRMTFQTVTFCLERISSKPFEWGLILGTKQRERKRMRVRDRGRRGERGKVKQSCLTSETPH